ncbi:hypothetical protein IU494_09800 [Nocardia terpenica]|uniref:hypothetical protein n=1 Tax=Nocardia terpenica TaxID=455432 RepID=UPI00189381B9|nr:hypothetical protein [Nocardia terpenica]MBF6063038.1 hypothetical protein [Nocardia terpenica]MBF6112737.1 hypothetical protein [Nocardia terpenica]MBF6118555.1 hypothetical protein [Nocardia terpenica]MBF6155034.1 hypothetical protein [Nocardia terpenica]
MVKLDGGSYLLVGAPPALETEMNATVGSLMVSSESPEISERTYSLREVAGLMARQGAETEEHRMRAIVWGLGWVDAWNPPTAAAVGLLVQDDSGRFSGDVVVRMTPYGVNRLIDVLR